jgi:Uma2 family endonuclease
MILHTIVDPELIWRQDVEMQAITEIEYNGIRLEVTRSDEKTVRINRIISTNLKDYLDPSLQPGSKMEYTLKSRE